MLRLEDLNATEICTYLHCCSVFQWVTVLSHVLHWFTIPSEHTQWSHSSRYSSLCCNWTNLELQSVTAIKLGCSATYYTCRLIIRKNCQPLPCTGSWQEMLLTIFQGMDMAMWYYMQYWSLFELNTPNYPLRQNENVHYPLFHTASDRQLGAGLGTRLNMCYFTFHRQVVLPSHHWS